MPEVLFFFFAGSGERSKAWYAASRGSKNKNLWSVTVFKIWTHMEVRLSSVVTRGFFSSPSPLLIFATSLCVASNLKFMSQKFSVIIKGCHEMRSIFSLLLNYLQTEVSFSNWCLTWMEKWQIVRNNQERNRDELEELSWSGHHHKAESWLAGPSWISLGFLELNPPRRTARTVPEIFRLRESSR